MHRSTRRDIRGSFGRFFAIFAIIALGVGFFSGVRITTPAMVHTMDEMFKEKNFFDYDLVSTLGWEEEDVKKIREISEVRSAEGSLHFDIICLFEEDREEVYKAYSLPEDINLLILREGRLPENDREVLVDNWNRSGLSLGDTLRFAPSNPEENLEHFRGKEYKVVGFADSSLYINFERGTTSLGKGMVTGFLYFTRDAFADDYYTDIYVDLDSEGEIYSEEYDKGMDARRSAWETAIQQAADGRYDRICQEAAEKLEDAKKELEDAKAENGKKLADAKKELEDAKAELADAKKELEDADQELKDSRRKIEDGEKRLRDGKKVLDSSKKQLDENAPVLEKSEKELTAAKKKLDETGPKLAAAKKKLDQTEKELDGAKTALEAGKAELDAAKALLPKEQYEAALAEYEKKLAEYNAGRKAFETGKKEYSAGAAEYAKGLKEYEAGYAAYTEGKKAYDAGMQKYRDGLAQYESSRRELANGRRKLEEGEQKYRDGLKEYEDGLAEYEDGLAEYEDGRKEYEEKIQEAEEKIADGERELADVKKPDTFLMERNTNIGYACFDNDSKIVEQVARVFPVFFILVAALVCMTTMTRMVEEQRGQIGILKALGYSNRDIMRKFTTYSGTASMLGCVIGYAVGIVLFPSVIWITYRLMYIQLDLKLFFDWKLALVSVLVSLLCSVGITLLSCRYELSESAAGLMRPKAPKPGKRVLLERITFIWNRLKFLQKVSVRNIFRYKGRLLMMVVGIGGSTALLLTGFGMKDSIAGFAEMQFEEIQVADAEVVFKEAEDTDPDLRLSKLLQETAEDHIKVYAGSWDLVAGKSVKSVNLIVPEKGKDFTKFFRLFTMEDETLSTPEKGEVLISIALSDRLGISTGQKIRLRSDDLEEKEVTVTGIFRSHVYNYVIASPEDFEKTVNTAYVLFPEGTDVYQAQAKLAESKEVNYITLYKDLKERMSKMMSSLDYIVLIVVLSAAGLAFVVLYNLTNINITERIREIATIKVLGFYPGETAQYVFRENYLLTFFGMLAGLGLGILLHRYVMSQIIVDMVYFNTHIKGMSYIYSIALSFVFTFLVSLMMRIKLERIDMAESLKSVE